MRRLRYWWPVIAWAALIWLFSTSLFDAASTGGIVDPLLRWLLPGAPAETRAALHLGIRKTAHFVEYFILGLLVYRGVRGEGRGWQPRWAWQALALAAGYAALDEIHQAFVPGRGAAVTDVLLDTAGAAAALLVLRWRVRRETASAVQPQ